ncbi:MAG: M23 family metallopeptidase, partial [Nocardioidaceae bacterium]
VKLVAFKAAEREKNTEQAQYNALVAERSRVEQILIARAKAEKAAAARKKAAREKAEREKGRKEGRPPRNIPDDPGGGGLSYPVSSYITSPYGMRFHPVLHYWKLHDGTDFGAGCGTPVRAADSGTVLSTYYSSGYGNQVLIDHGIESGVSLSTSYNHLTSFAVSPGEHVEQGEVIAYSGTTGYSTGCHLHFMVYENGATVDPMSWL